MLLASGYPLLYTTGSTLRVEEADAEGVEEEVVRELMLVESSVVSS